MTAGNAIHVHADPLHPATMNHDGLFDSLRLEPGDIHDYLRLSEHHYRAGRPATVTRVFVYRHHRPSVVGRYLRRKNESQTVAALVTSMPTLNCKMRHLALPGRYNRWRKFRDRARIVSREIRTISRVVVHPQWRSLGLATGLVRRILDNPETVYTEAVAAMGNVHPFFQHAGMLAYHCPPSNADARLVQALISAGLIDEAIELDGLTDGDLRQLDPDRRRWIDGEINRWQRTINNRRGAPRRCDDQLAAARGKILHQPVYYLYDQRQTQQPDTIDRRSICK